MLLTLPIVFVGLPGAGKTKVGRILAKKLGVAHVDTDLLVERREGRSVREIFAAQGEAAFRDMECAAVETALRSHAVISLGGGAVTNPAVRDMLRGHSVVFLDVDHDELVRRTQGKTHRPLLADHPDEALRRLREERADLYAQVATYHEYSDSSPADEVAERLYAHVQVPHRIVHVGGEKPYPVIIGRGSDASDVAAGLRSTCTKILLIHAPSMLHQAHVLAEGLRALGYQVHCADHPDAEAGKNIEVVTELWDVAGRIRLGRHDAIVAVGGGATTDMAGFVAATWLRGIDVIQVPTTVLAMVDAAVGGKTGINTQAGKNLVGSFHTPTRVIVDMDFLSTLPLEDMRSGVAEIAKCGFIRDGVITDLIVRHGADMLSHDSEVLMELVERSIRVKADVVSQDLHELGMREILNYGHTLAHAIERCENYRWRHGYAVAVGCVFAAELACARSVLDRESVDLHRHVFSLIGLPVCYEGASLSDVLSVMLNDKKVRSGQLRFVLLDGIGNPHVYRVSAEELTEPARKVGLIHV
ncbi:MULTISPECIES: 3-dehydroquinate synthase [unclassified Schaalia]|uniref:3-dehydroquinate synthase n=1 Tax=unclassified Schaalia TaxID=2691889 RepID=UPI001E48ACE8|nr:MULTISPECIES: 3-dehydroquinate synthase [unclassified Schaalia]MCD4549560.1 3-dehydroquinate synthase [Schaalia sp. lx-260]MCD4558169.1 3-dehydroquinate synthase [Schaalia sp. lx-100]